MIIEISGRLFLYEIIVTRERRKAGMNTQILNKTYGNRKTGYADYFAKMNKMTAREKVG